MMKRPKIVIDLNFTKFRRYSYSNLTPGSIHPLITPPKGEADNFQDKGIWVQGVEGPVKLLFGEFWIHWESIKPVIPSVTRGKSTNTIQRNKWK